MVTALTGQKGWAVFAEDARIRTWAEAARKVACRVIQDPQMQAKWLQCEGTWFVGVDALPTGVDGAIDGVPLHGDVVDALTPLPPLHPAQLSVVWPGYPKPRAGEGAAAFGYRLRRDAAHVDGIIADGPDRRRRVTEPHAFILGLPLTPVDPGASPLVVWEGSHRIMQDALRDALAPHDPEDWARVDVTEAYKAARVRVFDTCVRVALPARPGQATLLHPLALHGVAPWERKAAGPPEGRMIAYFRPPMPGGIPAWLDL